MKKLFALIGLLTVLLQGASYAQEEHVMYAHYINVGQAAAVLLEFPCGAILIDAGAQDALYKDTLVNYLTAFFNHRKDLNKTLALVMVTHPHIDHNEALKTIANTFTIERYIDDGLRVGSGQANQKWMQDNAKARNMKYEGFSFERITAGNNRNGMTDSIIDPINCPNGDPQIILYSGKFETQPDDWSKEDFNEYNNHSLVIKVVFGKASFLFTGDLEEKGINKLLDWYQPQNGKPNVLDVDVLMVGHHGAANATTDAYLDAVTPSYAVISCGEWDFGKNSANPFTTYAYGHPRISTINTLTSHLTDTRSQPLEVEAAEGAKNFRDIDITKRIYATPWDHTIIIRATDAGAYKVITDN